MGGNILLIYEGIGTFFIPTFFTKKILIFAGIVLSTFFRIDLGEGAKKTEKKLTNVRERCKKNRNKN